MIRNYLFFDTETTGFPPGGRLVELGVKLVNNNQRVLATIDMIVKPRGYEIPEGAAAIHGITTEKAEAVGQNIEDVLDLFTQLHKMADILIAHNIDFDWKIMKGEFSRYSTNCILGVPQYCTMKNSTGYCQLPGKFNSFKWPKLEELYEIVTGKQMEGAHRAMNDVEAMIEVFWTLRNDRIFKI